MLSHIDQTFMQRALTLAENGRFTAKPNPCVGCVIVKDQQIIAEGWHYRAGEAHAEVHALSQLAESETEGATAYVTLEPCAHQGRTGPCAQALVDARVDRVVYAMQDPNPLVAGKGLGIIERAGICIDGPLLPEQAEAINCGFVSRMQRQQPWVRCKLASSLDGRTAMASGESQWITGTEARQDVQRWRAQSCAVVTGIGSIEHDNSRLNLRASELKLEQPLLDDVLAQPPIRVVLDTRLRINENAAIFSESGLVLIITAESGDSVKAKQLKALHQCDIATVGLTDGHLSLAEALSLLASQYQCNDILLETGATLAGAFLQAGAIDELILYQAPVLMGSDARPLFDLPLQTMSQKVILHTKDQRAVGSDWRTIAQVENSH